MSKVSQKGSDQLIGEVVSDAGALPDFVSDREGRFFSEVRKLLEARAIANWPQEVDGQQNEAVFVLSKYPRQPGDLSVDQLTRVIDLPSSDHRVFGRIFFLSQDASNGTMMGTPCPIDDILDWLGDHDFTDCAVVIARKSTMQVSLRRTVNDDSTQHKKIRSEQVSVSVESLKDALSDFHLDGLLTPSACEGNIWEKGRTSDYVPALNTEKEIQKRLRRQLRAWFQGQLTVENEDSTKIGRIDVRLLASDPESPGLKYWTIIELKVVRSFRNAPKGKSPDAVHKSTVTKEVVKGVQQATSFTKNRELNEGFLEVYDMRKDKSVDIMENPRVKQEVAKATVTLHASVREMFGSADDARKAGYS